MTTHDQHTGHDQPTDGLDLANERIAPSSDQLDSPTEQFDQSTARLDPPDAYSEPPSDQVRPSSEQSSAQVQPSSEQSAAQAQPSNPRADVSPVGDESSSDRALFADDELSGLRARWDHVQAGFVDDPKDCVQKADGLVSDVVEQLTRSFSDARSRLEEQWARGEDASTEDLRVALKRYREFFQRLLAV